jgi:hypothetical protein
MTFVIAPAMAHFSRRIWRTNNHRILDNRTAMRKHADRQKILK